MSEIDIRLECLRLANATCGESNESNVLDTAKAYEAYVLGQEPAPRGN